MAKKDKSLTREQQKEVKKKEKELNKAKKALKRAKKSEPSPTSSTVPTTKEARVKSEPSVQAKRGRPLSAHEQASRTALKTDGTKTTTTHQGTTKEGQKVRVVTVTTKIKTIPKKKKGK